MLGTLLKRIDVLIELPPADLVGGLLIALFLAVATSTAYSWLARRKTDQSTALTTLNLVANVACMLVGGIYAEAVLPHMPTADPVPTSGREYETGKRRSDRFSAAPATIDTVAAFLPHAPGKARSIEGDEARPIGRLR